MNNQNGSKTQLYLIKKLLKEVTSLRKEVEDLKIEILSYQITRLPNDISPMYPTQPIGPYYDNPTPKKSDPFYKGPWMLDKVYSKGDLK